MTKHVTESSPKWHVVSGDRCGHCHTYVADEWVSDQGHRVRFKQQGSVYSGYGPEGLRVMDSSRHSSHEEAFAECVAASTRQVRHEEKRP